MKNHFKFTLPICIVIYLIATSCSGNQSCSVEGVGYHMGNAIAIKFNSGGEFNYSDMLFNQPKSFWGTWKQNGNTIITTNSRSTTGSGVGQQNTYTINCATQEISIGSFTLEKD